MALNQTWLSTYTMLLQPGKRSPWPSLGTATEVPHHADSERTFSFLADFLARCTNSHSLCQQRGLRDFPRRVIDLGSDNASIRLFEPEMNEFTGCYVALSYCWGNSHPLATTQETISQRKSNIEWEHLPRTFQDAVTVSRRFNIQYIWVDSLCIIQDSEADWEVESAKMADVYGNAFFTIAAVSSANSGVPFLVERQS